MALLGSAVKRGATDLHISVGGHPAMRVGGVLEFQPQWGRLTDADVERVLASTLAESRMRKFKETNEHDFSFSYKSAEGEARFRGNAFREARGAAVAFRLLPARVKPIGELGLPEVLKGVCAKRSGLFLVTGPTGHGKSTTAAAMIQEINMTRRDHIITIEDPIEYVFTSEKCLVHQREVDSDTSSFAEGLRRALRQDPDVIFIGEMRDLETIGAAVTAAETGHLVLGTLHTRDAPGSIDRVVDAFPPHQQAQVRVQLASTLVGICSQQLVPTGGERVCVTEVLMANSAISGCVREGKTHQIRSLIQTGAGAGMCTMEQSLAKRVKGGELPRETALAFAYDQKDLERLLA
jgi:twitching motility protein PilT